jgi:hypothetical protein
VIDLSARPLQPLGGSHPCCSQPRTRLAAKALDHRVLKASQKRSPRLYLASSKPRLWVLRPALDLGSEARVGCMRGRRWLAPRAGPPAGGLGLAGEGLVRQHSPDE